MKSNMDALQGVQMAGGCPAVLGSHEEINRNVFTNTHEDFSTIT